MTERRDPCRTAHVLLESMPSVMGYVTSEIRRQGPVENPVHFRLLRTLRERSRSLHELAELHSVRLPTMSRTVTVMETKGWLTRVRSERDRRSVVVSLTEAGREALSAVEDLAVSRTCGLLDELPAEHLAALNQGLEALYAVVREQLAAG